MCTAKNQKIVEMKKNWDESHFEVLLKSNLNTTQKTSNSLKKSAVELFCIIK